MFNYETRSYGTSSIFIVLYGEGPLSYIPTTTLEDAKQIAKAIRAAGEKSPISIDEYPVGINVHMFRDACQKEETLVYSRYELCEDGSWHLTDFC